MALLVVAEFWVSEKRWVWPAQSSQEVLEQAGARGKAIEFTGLKWELRMPLTASAHRLLCLQQEMKNAQRPLG